MDDLTPPRQSTAPCARTRLAESEVAAVDLCDCGMMHLHLGPFSLRLTPGALRGVLETLADAVSTQVERPALARGTRLLHNTRRGEA